MKQKKIEKIPYMTLPKKSSSKMVKFVGRTALVKVDGKEHFVLEVYKNDAKGKKIPVVRYVSDKEDYASYFPDVDLWTKKGIRTNDWYDGLVWEDETNGITFKERESQNILYEEEDLKRIDSYFKKTMSGWRDAWFDKIWESEKQIKSERVNRQYKCRMERLKKREQEIPELDKKMLLQCAETKIFKPKHYLYYKKRGRHATVCCSKCGRVDDGVYRDGMSYESQFEKHIREPINGCMGECRLCGTYGYYKPQGKSRNVTGESEYVYLLEKYHETGVVIRYIELSHTWALDEVIGDKGGPEMYGAHEEYSGVEIAREYMEKGKKIHRDYHKHNPYTGTDFWDDCNLSGMSNIYIRSGMLMDNSIENLKGTYLQYSGLKEYIASEQKVNVMDYMERYTQIPQMEMLVKLGLTDAVREMVKGYCGIVYNEDAKTVHEFFGFKKEHTKEVIEEKGNAEYLRILRWEAHLNCTWSKEQVKAMKYVPMSKIETALKVMSTETMLNRIEKYAGTSFEAAEECGHASDHLKHVAQTYLDYLEMRELNGYDLNNIIIAHPRDLEKAHQKMILEVDKQKEDMRLNEVKEKYPNIRHRYRYLRNRFFYQDEEYTIRPARSAEEIVQEGRVLHHCVGGDGYLAKHNTEKSLILMLRKEEDTAYVTVELNPEALSIEQWYGAYDKKPEEKKIQAWLKQYVTRLKATKNGEVLEEIQAAG